MTRRRYRWDEKAQAMVEIAEDWSPTPRTQLITDGAYDGLRATDGTPIDTRQKYRAYMKATGVTPLSDYKEAGEKAKAERLKYFTGHRPDAKRRDAIGRALYQMRTKR